MAAAALEAVAALAAKVSNNSRSGDGSHVRAQKFTLMYQHV